MYRIRTTPIAIGLCLLWPLAGCALAAGEPDLAKVDRRIAKEPVYKCKQPLYGLYAFGPEARTRVWAIFDRSQPDVADYDILYFDRNADGDLTASDERIKGKVEDRRVTFDIGTFVDPQCKQKHTEITITRYSGDNARVSLRMQWCDKVMIRGGYAADAGPYTQFAPTPSEAPVLWPGADGVFSFQFWQIAPLTIGAADDVRVFLGHRGHGPNTFCAVPDTFLPAKIPVLATLLYKDKDGKERQVQSELRERC